MEPYSNTSDLLEIVDTDSYGDYVYPNNSGYKYRERRDKRSRNTNISCQTCGRQYNHHSSLHTHIKLYCGKEPNVKCNYCDYTTFQKKHMRSHMVRKHKDVMAATTAKAVGKIKKK